MHGRITDVHKLMGDAPLQEQRLTRADDLGLSSNDRLHLSLHHVNGFVVISVEVNGGSRCSVASVFEQTELSVSVCAGQQSLHEDAGQHEFLGHGEVFRCEVAVPLA